MTRAVMPVPQAAAAAMIPKSPTRWQQAMRQAITDPMELLRRLALTPEQVGLAGQALHDFPLRVPQSYLARIRPADPSDPLLLQVLPQASEDRRLPGYTSDPVGDLRSERVPGLLHKYPGRVLLITTSACAIHCRYCFRREFPYAEQNARSKDWQAALALIEAEQDIEEVILSGGDPLSLSDRRLHELAIRLDGIPHLRRLRIHTRQPIVLPERVDEQLLGWLGEGRLQKIMVLHANHANEIDSQVIEALAALRRTGTMLLNQAVLLKGVNDSVSAQHALCQRLFGLGVLPYYLHQLDRVHGTAHFEVPDDAALQLHAQLTQSLPGYMVPRLVREVPGELSKTALGTNFQTRNHE